MVQGKGQYYLAVHQGGNKMAQIQSVCKRSSSAIVATDTSTAPFEGNENLITNPLYVLDTQKKHFTGTGNYVSLWIGEIASNIWG